VRTHLIATVKANIATYRASSIITRWH